MNPSAYYRKYNKKLKNSSLRAKKIELPFRRIAFDDDELLGEDSFDDKTAPVMLRSGFAEQFVEADILLFIEPERVLITRCSGVPVGYVCQFSVGIHNIG